jgi:hypothetical protein
MSLDLAKLEKVVDLADGGKQARCPACAESGQDRKGEHLRISPEGKFGCCVFPGDREHRRRIFALAGERTRRTINVRVAAAQAPGPVQGNLFGRLGRVFESPAVTYTTIGGSDASDGVSEVQSQVEEARTPRTGETESSQTFADYSRTPRTPPLLLTRIENEIGRSEEERELKEFSRGVRSVRDGKPRIPYLLADGTLVIPTDAPERYHWARGGQSVKETIAEIRAREKEVENGTTF